VLSALLGVGATGRSPLQALADLIIEQTEGNLFFVEEIVQSLFEEGVGAKAWEFRATMRSRACDSLAIAVDYRLSSFVLPRASILSIWKKRGGCWRN
jgi:hypothetical protein